MHPEIYFRSEDEKKVTLFFIIRTMKNQNSFGSGGEAKTGKPSISCTPNPDSDKDFLISPKVNHRL